MNFLGQSSIGTTVISGFSTSRTYDGNVFPSTPEITLNGNVGISNTPLVYLKLA
jgi:hypothetical protein